MHVQYELLHVILTRPKFTVQLLICDYTVSLAHEKDALFFRYGCVHLSGELAGSMDSF
jgi:hypothetical protein